MSDERWVREAIRLAAEARGRGDEPFGALLVRDGVVIVSARNAINTTDDPTQHAELRLISKASSKPYQADLRTTTLYTSTEPCAMCSGAIYWAGVPRVVFGLSATSLEDMTGGEGLHMPSRTVLGNASTSTTIDGPVLETEARTVHEGYW